MQRLFLVICTALLFFGPLGCGENYEPAESPTASDQAESQPAVEPIQPDPAAPAETQLEPPAAEISPEVSPEPEPEPEPAAEPPGRSKPYFLGGRLRISRASAGVATS